MNAKLGVVSVIIPVYNVEAYLEECVSSVAGQTYTHLEIILVDDGSSHNCPALCDEWARRDPRVRVIHKENGGLSDARNAGILAASGSYLTFVDSDDYLAPDMIEDLVELLETGSADMASSQPAMFGKTDAPQFTQSGLPAVFLSSDAAMIRMMSEEPEWAACGKVYRRSIFQTGLGFRVGIKYEDVEFMPRAIAASRRVALSGRALYAYRQREDSIMGITKEHGYSPDLIEVLHSNIEFARQHHGFDSDLYTKLHATYLRKATKVLAQTHPSSRLFPAYLAAYVDFSRQHGRP